MADSTRFIDAKLAGGLNQKLKLKEFSGTETVSSLFQFNLAFVSEQSVSRSELESDLLGKPVTITVSFKSGAREFSGIIKDVSTQAAHDGQLVYYATMVPFLWFLSRSSNCRVFQNMTTVEIVKAVVGSAGQVVDETGGSQVQKWPYSVQYRETDLNYISRLLEQDGIFYYFQHEGGTHKLVLGNVNDHFLPAKGPALPLRKGTPQDGTDLDELDAWRMQLNAQTGTWAHGDYNFTTAKTKLKSDSPTGQKVPATMSREIYDYPGEFENNGDGGKFSLIRAQEMGVEQATFSGEGRSGVIQAGRKLKLGDNPSPDAANKEFIAISVTHSGRASDFTGGVANAMPYQNRFMAISVDCPFRPKRSTPKPTVNGVLSAVVVGPPGEEIYTDEYGRVKVRFHWDRDSPDHDACSCFIRAAQLLAGRQWGFMAIPRIGQEVIVDFVDGDPDRPLIVGGVYNSDQMPAYDPKTMASRIYLKSNSTKGGNGFNELMLDDQKDAERVFLHAQKDLDFRVRNDWRTRVYGNEHHVVGWEKDGQKGGSHYYRVLEDNQIHVERHQDEHVEGNYRLMVGNGQADDGGKVAAIIEKEVAISIGPDGLKYANEGNVIQKIDGSMSADIAKDMKIKVGGGSHTTIQGDHNEKAANLSLELQQAANVKAGMKIAMEGGNEVHIKAGMNAVIEAGVALTLKVGGNFVSINPGGVFIQGTLVGINSGGAAGAGSGCMPQPPQPPDPLTDEPVKAEPKEPDKAHEEKTGYPSK